ncbi:MAG: thioesterase family protein [Alphaproteobacteria bacterium]|nr:thioesterase family protein [Alphaproteobacteria bacterium]
MTQNFLPHEELARSRVLPEWIDSNGHMNVAYYVLAFDQALDRFCDHVGIGWSSIKERNESVFVLETHVTYQQEVMVNDPLRITLQMLDFDEKRVHFFMRMFHAEKGYLAATSEQIMLHVGLEQRRAAPMPLSSREMLARIFEFHRTLPRPPEAGRVIGIRRKPER